MSSSNKEECATYNKTRELKVEENCFDTYEESKYLEQCNFYIEVRSNILGRNEGALSAA